MSINFRKSIKILPGVKINIGKKGISTSVGVRGAHVTVGKRGTRATVGIPGSGLSVTKKISGKSKKAATKQDAQSAPAPKLSTKELQARIQDGDDKKLLYRVIASLFVGGVFGYFLGIVCGIGAAVGLFFAMFKDLINQIAQRPLPAYKTKEAAQVALLNTLNAIKVKKINNRNRNTQNVSLKRIT